MLRQRMQHMIQESDPSVNGDLLRRSELCGVRGGFVGDDALLGGLEFSGVRRCWEMSAWFVRGQDAAVQGQGDLDFGLVGYARD